MCGKIGELLKKVVNALGPILAIALLAFAAYAIWIVGPAALSSVGWLSWMPASVLAISGTTAGYIALGASLLLDSDAVGEVVGDIAEGVGEVAGNVIAGLGGGIASGLAGGNFLTYALLGFAAWWFLFRDNREDEPKNRRSDETDDSHSGGKKRKEKIENIT